MTSHARGKMFSLLPITTTLTRMSRYRAPHSLLANITSGHLDQQCTHPNLSTQRFSLSSNQYLLNFRPSKSKLNQMLQRFNENLELVEGCETLQQSIDLRAAAAVAATVPTTSTAAASAATVPTTSIPSRSAEEEGDILQASCDKGSLAVEEEADDEYLENEARCCRKRWKPR